MSEINQPETDDGTGANNQGSAPNSEIKLELLDPETEGLRSSTLEGHLERLGVADGKRFGVAVVLQVFSGWAREKERLHERNAILREENAALRAANREGARFAPLKSVALTLGPLIALIGIEQVQSAQYGVGWALVIAGALFLAVGIYVGEVQVQPKTDLTRNRSLSLNLQTWNFSVCMTEVFQTLNALSCGQTNP
jgi:hypothetical protein